MTDNAVRTNSRAWIVAGWLWLVTGVGVGIWWLYDVPSPGKGGLVLALAATLMPLVWEKIEVAGKMAWIAMLFLLLTVEYRAIDRDRQIATSAEDARRKEEREKFQAIADGIKQTIETSESEFQATMSRSNTILARVGEDINTHL